MSNMPFMYDDGGRADTGRRGKAGDCVCRSIAIVTKLDYGYPDLSVSNEDQLPTR